MALFLSLAAAYVVFLLFVTLLSALMPERRRNSSQSSAQISRRLVTTQGIITTIAGTGTGGSSGDGSASTSAQLNSPTALCIDVSGNIFIADSANQKIRKVNTAGIISTYAGTGTAGSLGDGGKATSAQLNDPTTVSLDISGNLYISDQFNSKIRKINAAGIVSTFAGTGSYGSSGDNGAATSALLSYPWGVFAGMSGNVYIADTSNIDDEEGGFTPAKVLVLVTSLKHPVLAGATKLEVYSHANCKAGMLVTLSNPQYPDLDPEQRWIIAIGSLILDRPLERAYEEGTVITVKKKESTSGTESVMDNHKLKPGAHPGVSGKSALTMSAKSDLTISGKSTDMSVSHRRNHRNRIYPVDDFLTDDSPVLSHYNTSNNHSRKEMEAVREAGRMRLQDEVEEDDDEHHFQLEKEKKDREAAMQRRLQSASMREAKRRMHQEEEKQTDTSQFFEPREVQPSRAMSQPPVNLPLTTATAAPSSLPKVSPSIGAGHVDWDDLSVYTADERMFVGPIKGLPLRATKQPPVVIEQPGGAAQPPLTKVSPSIGAGHVDWNDLSVYTADAHIGASHVDWDDLSVYTAEERNVFEPRDISPSTATNQSPLVIDQPSTPLPRHRPMTAIEPRGLTRRNDHSSRWEQDLLSTGSHMLYGDESKAHDDGNSSEIHSLISGILSRRMNARHLSPLRRAQTAQSSRRSDETSIPAAVATAALPRLPKMPQNIGASHVDWDDLAVYTTDNRPVRQGHYQSPHDHDNSHQGQTWATASSRSRSFGARNMHAT